MAQPLIPCGYSSNEFGDVLIGCPVGASNSQGDVQHYFQFIKEAVGKKIQTFGIPLEIFGFDSALLVIFVLLFLIIICSCCLILYFIKRKRKK